MGKRIDCVAGIGITFIALFVYYRAHGLSWPGGAALSGVLTSLIVAVFRNMRRRWPTRRRLHAQKRASARAYVQALSFMKPSDALFEVVKLLSQAYPMEDVRFVEGGAQALHAQHSIEISVMQRLHPTPDDVLDHVRARKSHSAHTQIIALTGVADEKVTALAEQMTSPSVRLLDKNVLSHLAAKHLWLTPPAQPPRRPALRAIARRVLVRKRVKRYLFYGVILFLLYVLLGGPRYLLISLLLFTCAGLSLKRPMMPETLLR